MDMSATCILVCTSWTHPTLPQLGAFSSSERPLLPTAVDLCSSEWPPDTTPCHHHSWYCTRPLLPATRRADPFFGNESPRLFLSTSLVPVTLPMPYPLPYTGNFLRTRNHVALMTLAGLTTYNILSIKKGHNKYLDLIFHSCLNFLLWFILFYLFCFLFSFFF